MMELELERIDFDEAYRCIRSQIELFPRWQRDLLESNWFHDGDEDEGKFTFFDGDEIHYKFAADEDSEKVLV